MARSATKRTPKMAPAAMRKHAGDASRMLKALGNENRLMVLCVLADDELSVSELLDRVDLSQSALSQHLAILRREKLVTTRREAQSIFYSLSDSGAGKVIEVLHDIYCD